MAPPLNTAPNSVAAGADRPFLAISDRNLDAALLVARVLLVAVFPVALYYKIAGWPAFVANVAQFGVPSPNLWRRSPWRPKRCCPR